MAETIHYIILTIRGNTIIINVSLYLYNKFYKLQIYKLCEYKQNHLTSSANMWRRDQR